MGQDEWAGRSGIVGLVLAALLLMTVISMVCAGVEFKRVSLVAVTYLLAAIIIYFPSIKSVEFGNLKAELQDRIDKAAATLEQLRVIATYSVRQTLFSYAVPRMSYPGGRKAAFEMRDKAVQMLKDINASPEQISDALSFFNPAVEQYLYVDVNNAVLRSLNGNPTKGAAYIEALNKNFPENNLNIPPADAWEELAKNYVPWSSELEDNFEDLAFFQKTKTLRRPGVFYSEPHQGE